MELAFPRIGEVNDLSINHERTLAQLVQCIAPTAIFEAHKITIVGAFKTGHSADEAISTNFHHKAWFCGHIGILRLLVAGVSTKNIACIGV